MAAKYPTALPTADDWSTGNAGMGRTKTNKTSVNNLDHNFRAEEYNQQNLEIIALATKLGFDLSELPSYGDACLDSHDEFLRYLCSRVDKAGIFDHFLFNNYSTAITEDLGAVAAYGSDFDACGVANIALAAGVATGYTQTTWHFRQRYTYSRFRLKFATGGTLPATNGDVIQIGVMRDATHYSFFHSTRAGGAWPVWTCEVNDGGATDSNTTVATPVANTWTIFEIITTTAGATFWLNRGTASEEKVVVSGQAPENGTARPYAAMTSAVGGENFRIDLMGCFDTRFY